MSRPGMLIVDVQRCIACKRCMIECAVAHSQTQDLVGAMAEDPSSPPRVLVKPLGEFSAPYQCRHCDDPPCVPACPTGSLAKDAEDARVVLSLETCTGAAKCVKKCPFLGVRVVEEGGQAVKCDLCIGRIARGGVPACAEACPTGAITYKPYDELTDEERAWRTGQPGAALVRRTGVRYVIDPDKCIACRKCAMVCPAEAVEGAKKTPHRIIQERCVTCGACFLNCPKDAILALAPDAELPAFAEPPAQPEAPAEPEPPEPEAPEAEGLRPLDAGEQPEPEQTQPAAPAPEPPAEPAEEQPAAAEDASQGGSSRKLRRLERKQRRKARKTKGGKRPT